MYKYSDSIMRGLNRQFVRLFNNFSSTKRDELNVLKTAREMYTNMDMVSRAGFLKMAKHIDDALDAAFVLSILEDYDPVVKYVYTHEVDRKRARFAEAFIASPNKPLEAKTALRLWSAMIAQYAVTVTDHAYLEKYKKEGYTHVRWETVEDERRCKECFPRDGKVYPIDKVPPKPHIGCRCYLRPYKK